MYTRTHMHTFFVASVSAGFALNRVLDWEIILGPGYLGFSTGSSYLKFLTLKGDELLVH